MKRFLMGTGLAIVALVATSAMIDAAGSKGGSRGGSRGGHYNTGNRGSSHMNQGNRQQFGRNERGGHFNSGRYHDYFRRYGTRFSHGYYFYGRDHYHWTYRYFWPTYGCDCFWDPGYLLLVLLVPAAQLLSADELRVVRTA